MSIIFKLNELLDSKQMTQKQLAQATGLSARTISAVCNNTAKQLSMDSLMKLCQALNCQPGDIMEVTPE